MRFLSFFAEDLYLAKNDLGKFRQILLPEPRHQVIKAAFQCLFALNTSLYLAKKVEPPLDLHRDLQIVFS